MWKIITKADTSDYVLGAPACPTPQNLTVLCLLSPICRFFFNAAAGFKSFSFKISLMLWGLAVIIPHSSRCQQIPWKDWNPQSVQSVTEYFHTSLLWLWHSAPSLLRISPWSWVCLLSQCQPKLWWHIATLLWSCSRTGLWTLTMAVTQSFISLSYLVSRASQRNIFILLDQI